MLVLFKGPCVHQSDRVLKSSFLAFSHGLPVFESDKLGDAVSPTVTPVFAGVKTFFTAMDLPLSTVRCEIGLWSVLTAQLS